MTEGAFWNIIAALDWSKIGDDDAVIEPAVRMLSVMSVEEMGRFEELLAKYIIALEGAFQGDNGPLPVCGVLAYGRTFYEKVLNHPELMPHGPPQFEAILRIASRAYARAKQDYNTIKNERVGPNGWEQFAGAVCLLLGLYCSLCAIIGFGDLTGFGRKNIPVLLIGVPLFALLSIFLFWLTFRCFRKRPSKRAVRLKAGLCPVCCFDLRASTNICPECGAAIPADLPRRPIS